MNALAQLDGPSVAAGVLLGALVVLAWVAVCRVMDRAGAEVDRLIDEALAVGNDVPAKNVAAYERLGRSANR